MPVKISKFLFKRWSYTLCKFHFVNFQNVKLTATTGKIKESLFHQKSIAMLKHNECKKILVYETLE